MPLSAQGRCHTTSQLAKITLDNLSSGGGDGDGAQGGSIVAASAAAASSSSSSSSSFTGAAKKKQGVGYDLLHEANAVFRDVGFLRSGSIEVTFRDETGFGSGVTAGFYTRLAREFMSRAVCFNLPRAGLSPLPTFMPPTASTADKGVVSAFGASRPTCPGRHGLKEYVIPNKLYSCDICGSKFEEGGTSVSRSI